MYSQVSVKYECYCLFTYSILNRFKKCTFLDIDVVHRFMIKNIGIVSNGNVNRTVLLRKRIYNVQWLDKWGIECGIWEVNYAQNEYECNLYIFEPVDLICGCVMVIQNKQPNYNSSQFIFKLLLIIVYYFLIISYFTSNYLVIIV